MLFAQRVSGPLPPGGATLSFDDGAPLATRFELVQASDGLIVDSWEVAQAWYPRLEELALGTFDFTDFGIKPYSAFLGAVKNQDAFHV